MSDPTTTVTHEVQRKIDAIHAMDPADPNVSPDHGPCRLQPGEDAKLRRAKEEKVAEALRLKSNVRALESPSRPLPGTSHGTAPPSR